MPATESSARCMPEKSSTPFPITLPWHPTQQGQQAVTRGVGAEGVGVSGHGRGASKEGKLSKFKPHKPCFALKLVHITRLVCCQRRQQADCAPRGAWRGVGGLGGGGGAVGRNGGPVFRKGH